MEEPISIKPRRSISFDSGTGTSCASAIADLPSGDHAGYAAPVSALFRQCLRQRDATYGHAPGFGEGDAAGVVAHVAETRIVRCSISACAVVTKDVARMALGAVAVPLILSSPSA
jgi:hypothetical protein